MPTTIEEMNALAEMVEENRAEEDAWYLAEGIEKDFAERRGALL